MYLAAVVANTPSTTIMEIRLKLVCGLSTCRLRFNFDAAATINTIIRTFNFLKADIHTHEIIGNSSLKLSDLCWDTDNHRLVEHINGSHVSVGGGL